jgi:phosphoglycolate phosphatase-like HAD superfamily hydrolase
LVTFDCEAIFWDFDGVIKDSVKVKSDAFGQLFLPFGKEVLKKVRDHHKANGGMSRFEKLPIYLEWSGEGLEQKIIDKYEKKFSQMVKQRVIDSGWVEGVLNYLENNYQRQKFFLITATPQQEIEKIHQPKKVRQLNNYYIGIKSLLIRQS